MQALVDTSVVVVATVSCVPEVLLSVRCVLLTVLPSKKGCTSSMGFRHPETPSEEMATQV